MRIIRTLSLLVVTSALTLTGAGCGKKETPRPAPPRPETLHPVQPAQTPAATPILPPAANNIPKPTLK